MAPAGPTENRLLLYWKNTEEPSVACAGLVQHGPWQARYIGVAKGGLQAQWMGAAANLRRLFTLFEGDTNRMCQALGR